MKQADADVVHRPSGMFFSLLEASGDHLGDCVPSNIRAFMPLDCLVSIVCTSS